MPQRRDDESTRESRDTRRRGRLAAPILRRGSLIAIGLLVAVSTLPSCKQVPPDPAIVESIVEITPASARVHVEKLVEIGPRPSHEPEPTNAAAEYILGQLVEYGYVPEEERFEARSRWEGFTGEKREHRNIIAQVVGTQQPGRILEIGAHYDTHPFSPGADDNTSGVAGLLEIARVLAKKPLDRTVRFCFFAMEEDGLFGSRHHVERLREVGERVDGIFVLEMIGYTSSEEGSQKAPIRIPLLFSPPRRGEFIAVIGNFTSGGLGNRYEDCAERYEPALRYHSLNRIGGLFRDSARSDHSPYWAAGMRGIMLTDTANFRNPHYHRPTDTIDTLDFDFLAGVTRVMAATALEWADASR